MASIYVAAADLHIELRQDTKWLIKYTRGKRRVKTTEFFLGQEAG
jgi:hypothetical protein